MFNMGGGELFLIALVALLIIKPDKLPGLATSIGRWIGELTRSLNDVKRAVTQEVTQPLKAIKQIPKDITNQETPNKDTNDAKTQPT